MIFAIQMLNLFLISSSVFPLKIFVQMTVVPFFIVWSPFFFSQTFTRRCLKVQIFILILPYASTHKRCRAQSAPAFLEKGKFPLESGTGPIRGIGILCRSCAWPSRVPAHLSATFSSACSVKTGRKTSPLIRALAPLRCIHARYSHSRTDKLFSLNHLKIGG